MACTICHHIETRGGVLTDNERWIQPELGRWNRHPNRIRDREVDCRLTRVRVGERHAAGCDHGCGTHHGNRLEEADDHASTTSAAV